jgi:hypothetical protein
LGDAIHFDLKQLLMQDNSTTQSPDGIAKCVVICHQSEFYRDICLDESERLTLHLNDIEIHAERSVSFVEF